MTRRIVSLVLAASLLLLVGCGGGEQGASPPEVSASARGKPATTTQRTTGTPGQAGWYQGKTVAEEDYCIEKQFAQATQGLSQQEAADYETEVISESVARGVDPRTVLAERGFVC